MVSLRTVPDNIKAPWAASCKPSLEAAALVRFRPRPGKSQPTQKSAEAHTSTPGGNAAARVQPARASDTPGAKWRRSPSSHPGASSWRFQTPNNGQPITSCNDKETRAPCSGRCPVPRRSPGRNGPPLSSRRSLSLIPPSAICLKHLRTVSADDATILRWVNSTSAVLLIFTSAVTTPPIGGFGLNRKTWGSAPVQFMALQQHLPPELSGNAGLAVTHEGRPPPWVWG